MASTATKTSSSDVRAGAAFVEIYVKGAKAVNATLTATERRFKAFAVTVNRLSATVRMSMVALGKPFVTLNRALGQTVRSVRTAMRSIGSMVSNVGSKLTIGGVIGVGGLAYSIRTFAMFEETMSAVKAVSKATGGEFERLNTKAKHLGETTRFTTQQVGKSMEAMAMAGFKPHEIESGIEHVLSLALAGPLDIDQAADIAAKISIPFGIAAKDIDRVADALAMAATSSATTVEEMGFAFKYAAASASANAQSLEDMAAAMSVLANSGQNASTAGTQLRMIMMKLADNNIRSTIERYGVGIKDAAGNMRPVLDILVDLDRATEKIMDKTDQFGLFSKLFGARAATGAIVLARNPNAIAEQRANQAANKGSAAEMGRIKSDNLMGDFIKLWSAIEAVQIAIGESLLPELRRLTQYITEQVMGVTAWIRENQDLVVTIAKGAAVTLAAGVAVLTLGGAFSFLGSMMAPVVAIAGVVVTALTGGAMVLMSLAGLLGGAVVAGFMALATTVSLAIGALNLFVATTTAIITAIPLIIAAVVAIGPAIGSIGTAIGSIGTGMMSAIAAFNTFVAAGGIVVDFLATVIALSTGVTAFIGTISNLENIGNGIKSAVGSVLNDILDSILAIPKYLAWAMMNVGKGIISVLKNTLKEIGNVAIGIWGVFQQVQKNFMDLVSSIKESFQGVWDAISIGDMATAMEIVWADIELRFAQGKEFLKDFGKELEGVFQKLAEIIKFAFSEVWHEIKAGFYRTVIDLKNEMGSHWNTALSASLIPVEFAEKGYQESAGVKGIMDRRAAHQNRLSTIGGADFANTTPEIVAAENRKKALAERTRERRVASDEYNASQREYERMLTALADPNAQKAIESIWGTAPTPEKKEGDSWISEVITPDKDFLKSAANYIAPLGEGIISAFRQNIQSVMDSIPMSIANPRAFAGSLGTFSGLGAAAGGMGTIEGKVDTMIDLLEDIEENTEEGDTYY